jgi:hypothetical protein
MLTINAQTRVQSLNYLISSSRVSVFSYYHIQHIKASSHNSSSQTRCCFSSSSCVSYAHSNICGQRPYSQFSNMRTYQKSYSKTAYSTSMTMVKLAQAVESVYLQEPQPRTLCSPDLSYSQVQYLIRSIISGSYSIYLTISSI